MSYNTILATAPLTTQNYHLKMIGTTIGNSLIWDNGTNVGIGTITPTLGKLQIDGSGGDTLLSVNNTTTNATGLYLTVYTSGSLVSSGKILQDNSGNMRFNTGTSSDTERMRITSTGNVGIGTISPAVTFEVNSGITTSGYSAFFRNNSASQNGFAIWNGSGEARLYSTFAGSTAVNCDMTFYTTTSAGGQAERMRITSGGYTKISNSGTYEYVNASVHEIRNSAADYILYATNPNANPYGYYISYPSASPNSTANYFIACADSTAARFRVASNGNCYNVTGTYTSGVSDIRYKEQIVDANSQWNDIKNLRVVNFKFIKDVEENGDNALRHIGFIAQEVEKTSPHLIDEMSDEKTGETWKTIKTSIIHTKSIKALQEAMARIETLESTIQNLQEQINILSK